ncbi:hypothetical protein [Gilvimarinus sp. DA14]|uniref:hypothetical protein n=1 Tax=Gilvimarinus sp. DA14 TaxID=2956798 RepID=UPI0020B88674|nr:hypothetical protein [Gilvimarinus sp. DA14]UTF58769.1 hypothetical protein NHM04_09785 [Gilvimarinus sp. DA14]
MSNNSELNPVIVERASEQLRQERETFDQAKAHDQWWFILRLVMGFSSVVLLVAVMVVSVYILFNSTDFPVQVVTAAGAALFVDVLGMLMGVWKIALNPRSVSKLQPTTQSSIPDAAS